MKLGIYVGSFDPVHLGHIHVINYLLNNNYVDKVMIITTGDYWDKVNTCNIETKISILKHIHSDKIIINDKDNYIQYTYQILRELNKRYNDSRLYLILGTDLFINFDKWKEYKEILNNNYLLVMPRGNTKLDSYINKYENKDRIIIASNFKNLDISSTMIRELLKNKNYQEASKYLDKEVLEYIKNNKLYEE